ncbi:hypothetical protein ACFX1X_047809 [Malus domestica]
MARTLKTQNSDSLRFLLTKLSRASKSTSEFRQEKFSISIDVKFLGKQLNQSTFIIDVVFLYVELNQILAVKGNGFKAIGVEPVTVSSFSASASRAAGIQRRTPPAMAERCRPNSKAPD